MNVISKGKFITFCFIANFEYTNYGKYESVYRHRQRAVRYNTVYLIEQIRKVFCNIIAHLSPRYTHLYKRRMFVQKLHINLLSCLTNGHIFILFFFVLFYYPIYKGVIDIWALNTQTLWVSGWETGFNIRCIYKVPLFSAVLLEVNILFGTDRKYVANTHVYIWDGISIYTDFFVRNCTLHTSLCTWL